MPKAIFVPAYTYVPCRVVDLVDDGWTNQVGDLLGHWPSHLACGRDAWLWPDGRSQLNERLTAHRYGYSRPGPHQPYLGGNILITGTAREAPEQHFLKDVPSRLYQVFGLETPP